MGSTLCMIGSSIKAFSVSPDRFYVLMIGQMFSALSLVFTYSLVGRFSASWFSSEEISTAGALGCVGDQVNYFYFREKEVDIAVIMKIYNILDGRSVRIFVAHSIRSG